MEIKLINRVNSKFEERQELNYPVSVILNTKNCSFQGGKTCFCTSDYFWLQNPSGGGKKSNHHLLILLEKYTILEFEIINMSIS